MNTRRRMLSALVLLLVGICLLTGCTFKSPVLLIARGSALSAKKLPLSVGVVTEGYQHQSVTQISTYQFPFVFMKGQLPKPIELEYITDCITDYFRDYGVFDYVYAYPFDPTDVDLILRVKPNTLEMANTPYGTGMSVGGFVVSMIIPGVQLIAILALPQEQFVSNLDVGFAVETPEGGAVAEYSFAANDEDWVWIYSQPFGNYIWHNSVHRTTFFELMDSLKTALEKDADELVGAAGK